ncbi:MAG: SdiA-regulated domain-containing protein, partial [Gammaproteobacteria bacterium]|nr:SdiA-regulated domain-containing protein [Gammaproteobacteria bacterium]
LMQWKLPGKLREISGLVFHDGRLFGHNDQLGIVYELDYQKARLVKAFALGEKTARSDFEGIAVANNHFYMINSDGRLYMASEGGNGERVKYKTQSTQLGKKCEIEGLAYSPLENNLLIVCKQARTKALKNRIAIFKWSLSQNKLLEDETLIIKVSTVRQQLKAKDFNPSGIEIDTKTGNLLLIAARQRAIAEFDSDGKLLRALTFPLASRHRQAEGIALTPDGILIIADEGGRKKARLAIYQPDA